MYADIIEPAHHRFSLMIFYQAESEIGISRFQATWCRLPLYRYRRVGRHILDVIRFDIMGGRWPPFRPLSAGGPMIGL